MVSPRNEAASLGALLAGLRRKLTRTGGSADQSGATGNDEDTLIASLQADLERHQQQCQREVEGIAGVEVEGEKLSLGNGESGSGGAGAAGGTGIGDGVSPVAAAATMKSLRRRIAALRVRLEERAVVTDAIAALEASLRELQSAASSGVGAIASFETLDSRR